MVREIRKRSGGPFPSKDGIESVWSYAKRQHQKFDGLRRSGFPAFPKETGFRFDNRQNDLCRILLTS